MFSADLGVTPSSPTYIEDVFSTYLYTGTGSAQTITNGIDLSGKGGMVWMKDRTAANPAFIMDTLRGTSSTLQPSTTGSAGTISTAITAFNSTGFTIGTNSNINTSSNLEVSWTFRKQAKFFDVVTYTGNGVAGRTISHNLESVPGCMIVKGTSAGTAGFNWRVYHRSLISAAYRLSLNATAAQALDSAIWNSTAPTASVFTVGSDSSVNANGETYVAYLFAHDAGGFGASGADSVISCGSWTGTGSAQQVTLGWEPQFIIAKNATSPDNWFMIDTMRSWPATTSAARQVYSNTAGAEVASNKGAPNATGFNSAGYGEAVGDVVIYIAIRRGPMRTPTSGASVFSAAAFTGTTTTGTFVTTNFVTDLAIGTARTGGNRFFVPRLTNGEMYSNATNVESAGANYWNFQSNIGFTDKEYGATTNSCIDYGLKRAPGFFDVVCYTGTGVPRTVNHNLGAAPELMITKDRTTVFNWWTYVSSLGNATAVALNLTVGSGTYAGTALWNSTTPTGSVFSVDGQANSSGDNYVAYLFASCAGVSKIGSYSGTSATQTINCGFTSGARFVLIKRADTTGDWYVWDTARGMISGTDPSFLLNSAAAEVNANSVYTTSVGFQIVSTAAGINATGGTYLYMAIA